MCSYGDRVIFCGVSHDSTRGRAGIQSLHMNTLDPELLAKLPEAARWKLLKNERDNRYANFRKKYFNDPVGFVRDCSDITLYPYQADVMNLLVEHKKLSVSSLHGVGKTMTSALIVLWFALTRDVDWPWKAILTASNARQLEKYLVPDIRDWGRALKWDVIGRPPFVDGDEMLKLSLNLSTGAATTATSTHGEGIEGAHSPQLLYLCDEAKLVSNSTFDAIEGALSNFIPGKAEQGYAMCVSTPGAPSGRFYEIQSKHPAFLDWHVRHITLQEAVDAGQVGADWANNRKIQWGEKSAIYRSKVLGMFTEAVTNGLIPIHWIEAANDRWTDLNELGNGFGTPLAIGVDIAGRGKDKTKLSHRTVRGVSHIEELTEEDVMSITMQVRAKAELSNSAIVIDQVGIGEGAYSRLRELGCPALPFNSANKSVQKDVSGELGFFNMRAAGYWRLREMLDPANHYNLILPPNDELMAELTAITYEIVGDKIKLESKKDFKKRISRSPDTADAVVYSMALELLESEIAAKRRLEGDGARSVRLTAHQVPMIGTGRRGKNGSRPMVSGRRGSLFRV